MLVKGYPFLASETSTSAHCRHNTAGERASSRQPRRRQGLDCIDVIEGAGEEYLLRLRLRPGERVNVVRSVNEVKMLQSTGWLVPKIAVCDYRSTRAEN